MTLSPFHLAIPVHDLPAARRFYGEVFGLSEGRSAEHWVDFDFFGHQLVIHQHPQTDSQRHAGSNPVDGHDVPVPHFGDWMHDGHPDSQPHAATASRVARIHRANWS